MTNPQVFEKILEKVDQFNGFSPFQDWKDPFKHFLAGGVAGAVSRTAVSPLERLKIIFQVFYFNQIE